MNYSVNSDTLNGIINTLPNYIINFSSSVIFPSQSYLNSNQRMQFNIITKNYLSTTDYI
jgi:hypothetical protein